MGHTSPRTALIYLHATRERDQQIAAGMGRVYTEARSAAVPVNGHSQQRTAHNEHGVPRSPRPMGCAAGDYGVLTCERR